MGGRGSGVDRNDFCTIFPHAGRGGLHKMKNFVRLIALLAVPIAVLASEAASEDAEKTSPKEVYTGSIAWIGGVTAGSLMTTTFTLTIDGYTSDEEAEKNLAALQEGKQESLLNAIRKENKGTFAITGEVGHVIGVVRVHEIEGKRRIFVVFERWLKMAEVRNGYRSEEYPFSVIELVINPDGKGEGTFIGAAQITWKTDKKTGQKHVNIEDFATYPARLMGVERRDLK